MLTKISNFINKLKYVKINTSTIYLKQKKKIL